MWPRKSSKKAAEKAAAGPADTGADKAAKKAAEKAAKKASQASARAAKAARASVYQKPRADLYTFLLVVAWLALLVGILFLCLQMNGYDFKFKGGPAPPVGMIQTQATAGICFNFHRQAFVVLPDLRPLTSVL